MGSEAGFVLITRPEEEAQIYASELREQGFSVLVEPMLSVEAIEFEVPDLDGVQALLFTSAQALKFFSEKVSSRSIPLYVVGHHTKNVAQSLGYEDVFSARGAGGALVSLVRSEVTDKNRALLHVRGRHVARNLKEELSGDGFSVQELIVYETSMVNGFSSQTLEALKSGRIGSVTFFSKRTAEAFLRNVDEGLLSGALSGIKALCISEGVLKCVQSYSWFGTYKASRPDRQGMLELLKRHGRETQIDKDPGEMKMSASNNKAKKGQPIENAAEVIERFGGIRPMAKKIDVAVTTVQGWKKRDVIPAGRRASILEAAQEHNVDLTDIMADAPAANENVLDDISDVEDASSDIVVETTKSEKNEKPVTLSAAPKDNKEEKAQNTIIAASAPVDSLEKKLADVERKVVTVNTWIVLALIVVALAAVTALVWPQAGRDGPELDRLSALEARTQEIATDVEDVKDQQSFFGTLIPDNLDEQLANLQDQAGAAKEQIGQAVEKAQEVSADVLAEDGSTLTQRAQKLEGHLQEITGSPVLAGLLTKVEGMSEQPEGQSQLDTAMSELSAVIGNMGQDLSGENSLFESTLDAARGQSDALGQTFENVPATDLKAAAMLLAMSQFRSSLNRDSEAFDQDLQILLGLIGEENVELRRSLERLAPHADSGVLTPPGLVDEFKSLAGEAVVSSLKGEDVSLGEKAKARFGDLIQVEKNGERVNGTDTQVKVHQAETLLEGGNIGEALSLIKTLDGPALAQMSGWINKAEATLMAGQIQKMLGQSINLQAYGGAGGVAGDAADALGSFVPGSSQLIQNEETGINILRRNKISLPKNANPF